MRIEKIPRETVVMHVGRLEVIGDVNTVWWMRLRSGFGFKTRCIYFYNLVSIAVIEVEER
jgi:hypothetical protein